MVENNADAALEAGLGAKLHLIFAPAGSSAPSAEAFACFHDLAVRAERLRRRGILDPLSARAFARDGSRIPIGRALAAGAKVCDDDGSAWTRRWRPPAPKGYERRNGPVPGTACHRGGGSYYRRVAFINAAKSAQDPTGGEEPKPRGARNVSNLPNSWDDYAIGRQRCWKRQSKGRKAWARAGREPEGDRKAAAWDSPWDDGGAWDLGDEG